MILAALNFRMPGKLKGKALKAKVYSVGEIELVNSGRYFQSTVTDLIIVFWLQMQNKRQGELCSSLARSAMA